MSVKDIGTPEEAGNAVLRQYLTEFMSTRIGVIRQGEVISGAERQALDGKIYYDIEVHMRSTWYGFHGVAQVILRSYASRSQLAVTEEERQKSVELEWERKLFTVIGVANKRKYEFRLQSDRNAAASDMVNAI